MPAAASGFRVLAGHALFVAALKPGALTIFSAERPRRIVVRGRSAEVGRDAMTALAEEATAVEDTEEV